MIPQVLEASSTRSGQAANREEWLTWAAVALRPWFAAHGYDIPLRLRIGVGALAVSHRTLGALYPQSDALGFKHITISPFVDDPATVVLILVHELIHAILPAEELHGARFQAAARALGLAAPFTRIHAEERLRRHVEGLVHKLGRYPHRAPLAEGAIYSVQGAR